MEVYGIIYLLIDATNDKEYVGQTTRPFEAKFYQHMHSDQYIDRVMRKRGEDLIATAILKECYSKAELDYWEIRLIKSRDTMAPNGYNLTEGGEGGKPCEESRARNSASKSGEKHPFFGKHHTPQHCANIAKSLTDKKKSPEHCANVSKSKKGKTPEDKTRDRMAESRLGEKNHNYGKPRETETCLKIGVNNRLSSKYKNLQSELDAHGFTYTALAKILGIHPASVSEKMRGRKRFTEHDKAILVEFFGKPEEYLFQCDEEACANPSESHRKKSPYKNLQNELDAQNISYAKLAELMGADKNSIARKIRGVRSFMDREKAQIAEILGKSVEYLFQRDE